MNKYFLIVFILGLLFLLSVPPCTTAQDMTLVPFVDIKGEYDDNITFTRTQKIDDYALTVSPGLRCDYATERLNLESDAIVDFIRYDDQKNLDTENQHYRVNSDYRLTERYTLSGNFSFIDDTTLESELEETGLVTARVDRKRYNGGMGMSYQLTQLSDMSLDYDHAKTDYAGTADVDYDSDAVTFSYNRLLKTQLDMVTLKPYYTQYESDVSETDNYGLSLGWLHRFSETLSLTTFLGSRYTRTDYIFIKESNWGGVVDARLEHTGETAGTTLGLSRNIIYSSTGTPIQRDRVYVSVHQRLVRRLSVRFTGSLYLTKAESQFPSEDSRYIDLSPSVTYKLTEDHRLNLGYSFSQDYDKVLQGNDEADRHRVWVTLGMTFPQKP